MTQEILKKCYNKHLNKRNLCYPLLGTNPAFAFYGPFATKNCGKNHFIVEIPGNEFPLFDFFEMNLNFLFGRMKSFGTEKLGRFSITCFHGIIWLAHLDISFDWRTRVQILVKTSDRWIDKLWLEKSE